MNKYAVLNRLRIMKDEPWELFAERFREYGVSKLTLFRVLTGRGNPNERTAAKLARFMHDHYSELRKLEDKGQEEKFGEYHQAV